MESLKKIIIEEEGNILPITHQLSILTHSHPIGMTFKPNINNKSRHLGRNDKAGNSKNDGVFDRLYERSKKYREKHQQRIQYAEKYDPSSGTPLSTLTLTLIH